MTGLEKMKSQILEEARTQAEQELGEAKETAAGIREQAAKEAERIRAGILAKSDAQIANYRERVQSSIDLKRRTQILAAKQEIIREILEEACASLEQLEPEPYFRMLAGLLESYVLPGQGEIRFSDRDLNRLPAGYREEIRRIAAEKGAVLTISEKPAGIENGFILVYGGVEENCTLRAIFDTKRAEFSDRIRAVLFDRLGGKEQEEQL